MQFNFSHDMKVKLCKEHLFEGINTQLSECQHCLCHGVTTSVDCIFRYYCTDSCVNTSCFLNNIFRKLLCSEKKKSILECIVIFTLCSSSLLADWGKADAISMASTAF